MPLLPALAKAADSSRTSPEDNFMFESVVLPTSIPSRGQLISDWGWGINLSMDDQPFPRYTILYKVRLL